MTPTPHPGCLPLPPAKAAGAEYFPKSPQIRIKPQSGAQAGARGMAPLLTPNPSRTPLGAPTAAAAPLIKAPIPNFLGFVFLSKTSSNGGSSPASGQRKEPG